MNSAPNGLAPPAWRQFTFFDATPVQDKNAPASSPEIFKITPEISCIISSTIGVLVADIHGSIHALSPDFEVLRTWEAYQGGRASHMVARGNLLVTIGEEDVNTSANAPVVKAWDLAKKDKKKGSPVLLRSVKIKTSSRPHPVSTIALSKTSSHFAIGLADGTVLFYRNFDQSLASSGSLTSLPKPKVIHESPKEPEPITGLGFRDSLKEDEVQGTHLFIVTTNRVLAYHVSGKGSGGKPTLVDEVGCGLGCAAMDRRGKDIIVAREEALYMCGVDGRGQCYAYEGNKSSIHVHMNYVVIVSPPLVPSASAQSKTIRSYVARAGNAVASDITKVTVFDHENRMVAFSGTFEEGVREIFEGWGEIYVLGSDGKVSRLEEKSTSAKLDILFERKLYPQALGLAKSQSLEPAVVSDIHRAYGDHFYGKSDYESAMQQYIETIGWLQPSYVIRKYLDAQRIPSLTTYLQELHAKGLANSDHTTLLLNTYTKLKDNARLDSFIKSKSQRPKTDDDDEDDDQPPFDLDTVIRVCRQAGYFDHAAYLAKKYNRHEDYLRIIVEDKADYTEGLAYVRASGTDAATATLARYGRQMLTKLPDETTQLLIDLCTGTMSATARVAEREASAAVDSKNAGAASYLSYLALNSRSPPSPSPNPAKVNGVTPINPQAERIDRASESRPSDSKPSTPAPTIKVKPPPPPEKLPAPRTFAAHFLNHREHFVRFLEEVAEKRWGQTLSMQTSVQFEDKEVQEQKAVWNTLLELYLPLPASLRKDAKSESQHDKDKALLLLKSDTLPYDREHALMLCTMRSYTSGMVLIWEKMGMYDDILRFYIDRHNNASSDPDPEASKEVLRHLKKYGPSEPNLYKLVLRFLTSNAVLLEKHLEDVKEVLEYIEREKVMAPIDVVQVLSRNSVASVGLVQAWLMERIKESKEDLDTNRALITSYRTETAAKLKQIDELSDSSQPKVFQATRCSTCGAQLDLPTVHFMCGHSYHQRCLHESESECPSCARSNGVISEIRRNNERLAGMEDVFLSEVKDRGFEAIAGGFGRGWLAMKPGQWQSQGE